MKQLATIHLDQGMFTEKETPVVEQGEFQASAFRFASGVCALRLRNSRGNLVMLPYQGQQIWSVVMDERDLTMKSMFDQPYPTRDFLSTFGGFLHHCGATSMGVPGPGDNHPLHGDLHNAPYQTANILLGEDENGVFIGLTGTYQHTLAFNYNYVAEPVLKLYEGQAVFGLAMNIHNRKRSPMPLMYLVHANFRPVDGGQLYYSADCSPEHMRVNQFPASADIKPEFRTFVEDLKLHPEKHMSLDPEKVYDPEIVICIDYKADAGGWARSLQVHPDGSADVVRHRPDQLKRAQRWICRTPDQDALGFEPCTAEGSGFTNEKAKGNVEYLGPGESFHCDLEIGVLTPAQAAQEVKVISEI